jgi:hypothetical protein
MKIAVDVTKLLPGGGNGGIKKTIFSFLNGVRKISEEEIVYCFLCNNVTEKEVEEEAEMFLQILKAEWRNKVNWNI